MQLAALENFCRNKKKQNIVITRFLKDYFKSIGKINETIFEKQVPVDGAKKGNNKAWQNYSSDFETTAATSNAWLYLSPEQMLILAESLSDQQDRIDALCEITLGLYSKDSELHWDYDEGFGVMRKWNG